MQNKISYIITNKDGGTGKGNISVDFSTMSNKFLNATGKFKLKLENLNIYNTATNGTYRIESDIIITRNNSNINNQSNILAVLNVVSNTAELKNSKKFIIGCPNQSFYFKVIKPDGTTDNDAIYYLEFTIEQLFK